MQAQILESGMAGRGFSVPVLLQKGYVLDVVNYDSYYVYLEYPELGLVVFPKSKVKINK